METFFHLVTDVLPLTITSLRSGSTMGPKGWLTSPGWSDRSMASFSRLRIRSTSKEWPSTPKAAPSRGPTGLTSIPKFKPLPEFYVEAD